MDNTHELAYRTLGRIQAIVEMMDQPELYRMTSERALERIREIMAEYQLNREVPRG